MNIDVITLRPGAVPSAVFVYGTLMTGQRQYDLLQAAGVRSISPASVAGELLDLGEYPALRHSLECASRVYGECVEVERLDALLESLDQYEGSEYRRDIVEVTLQDGRAGKAWAYVLAGDGRDFKLIASGRWSP